MFEKNDLKHFRLTDTGFSCKDRDYAFDQIASLYFLLLRTSQRMNLLEIGEANSATLELTITDGGFIRLLVDEHGPLYGLNWNKADAIKNLINIYATLARASFPHRLKRYEGQLDERGYFEHDGCKFFPPKRIEFRTRNFDLNDHKLVRGPTFVEIRPRSDGMLQKLKREFTLARTPGFDTRKDGDVLFDMLERHYRIRFKL